MVGIARPMPVPATAQIGTASHRLTDGDASSDQQGDARRRPGAKPARSNRSGWRVVAVPCHHEPADQPSAARVSGIPTTRGVPPCSRVRVSGR